MSQSRTELHDSRSTLERFAPGVLLSVDFATWIAALFGSVYLLPHSQFNLSLIWIAPLVGIVSLYLIGGYDRRTDFLGLAYVSEHLIGLFAAALVAMFLVYAFSAYNETIKPSRALVPMLFLLFTVPSIYFRRVFGGHLQRHHCSRSLLVLGAGGEAARFYREYAESSFDWKLEFVDPFGTVKSGQRIDGEQSPVVESDAVAKLAKVNARYAAILLACDAPQLPSSILQRLITMHCSHVPVLTLEAFHEKHWRRVSINAVGPEWLFDCEFRLARGSLFSHVKRLIDVTISALGLIFLFPLLVIAGVIIRLESRGPAIFRQERVGRDGRIFLMYKLRTMRENSGDIYTRKGDQRITRFGNWLRVTRLDELPQLWNVLIGDMSLIGPRAEWVKCAEIYERDIPNYHLRHLVTPGITGWAQVRFKYGESESDTIEKFQFDLYYIRYFSLELDVSIVLKTIHTIICGGGR
ncbi:MAG: exopolysaccharide biosynthesis polyprenyl glycosylphosphotransferase [Verrucomicrobiota bacterium]